MRKLAFTGIVLQPSVASTTGVAITTFGVMLVSLFNFAGSKDYMYNLLLGPGSPPELIDTTKSFFDNLSQTVFDNPTLNRVLFFCFWLFIGLIVYAILTGAGLSLGAMQKMYDRPKLLNARRATLAQDAVLRLTLRLTALLGWVLYTAVFWKLFFPFSIMSFQVAFGLPVTLASVGYGLLGIAVLATSLHLHLVLLRCFLLRPRVIGGWDDAIAAHLT